MTKTDKAKADRIERSLRDGELDAVSGGMFNAFANFGDIKGECENASGTQPLRTYTIGFGQPF